MNLSSNLRRELVERVVVAVLVLAIAAPAAIALAQTPTPDPNDVFRPDIGKPLQAAAELKPVQSGDSTGGLARLWLIHAQRSSG
jgi:hypothetical protein